MSTGVIRPAVGSAVVMLLVFLLLGVQQRSEAAFSATALNQGNSFAAAAAPAGSGALYAWGDTGDSQLSPDRVDDRSTWRSVTNGDHFTCGIDSGNALYCWGTSYTAGQLGTNDSAAHLVPTKVGSAAWSQVSAGASHACGIQTNGTLWCWGEGANGRLGQESDIAAKKAPVQVLTPATTGWKQVSAGNQFTCAVRTDQSLYCFGRNASGETGNGTTTTYEGKPVQVTPSGWDSVSLGYQHACGVRTSSQLLFCWGDGGGGRLGVGNTTTYNSPQQVGSATWQTVGLGTDHSCGVQTSGRLYCWGVGGNGRLGTGTSSDQSAPQPIGTDATWKSISPQHYATCGSKTDGTLWCWGQNTYGQLGTGDTTDRSVPTQAGTATTWSAVGPGPIPNQACAVRTDGTLWCWGDTLAVHFTPLRVDAVTTWTSVVSGNQFACGTRLDASLWCWGRNTSGRLGVGDTANRFTPAQVTGGAVNWKQVSASTSHACAVGLDATLWCWGSNSNGKLGVGSTSPSSSTTPLQVRTPATDGWKQVSVGNEFSCAVRTDNTLYCWGRNANGEAGKGVTSTNEPTPVAVTVAGDAAGWSLVGTGYQHACGIRTDKQLYCWGDGGGGRLGNGAAVATNPAPLHIGTDSWRTLGLGTDHTCGVQSTGALYCWGAGGNGRLGLGAANTGDKNTPQQVGTDTNWATVTGGTTHSCGTRAFGSVWCWGNNTYGQLGIGSSVTTQRTPAQITGYEGRPVGSGPNSNLSGLVAAP